MINTDTGAVRGPDRFDEIEALLKNYPDVTDSQLDELKRWFKKEASAFEVASLSSKDTVTDRYLQFRTDHLDRVGVTDLVVGLLFAAVVVGVLAAIWVTAP